MKKIIFLALITLVFSGCGQTIENVPTANKLSSTHPEAERELIDKIDSSPIHETIKNNSTNKILNVKPNSTLSSPVIIEGETNAKRDHLIVELRDKNKNTKVKDIAVVRPKNENVNTFSIKLFFQFGSTDEGFVAIYTINDNGEKSNLVEIPVKFLTLK